MVKTTMMQRRALVRVYRRIMGCPPFKNEVHWRLYRKFRRTVQPGPGCIMVPFAGMWLGIEPDGYTHS